MAPKPRAEVRAYQGRGTRPHKVVLVQDQDRDSGVGRTVAILFAKEGANQSVVYLNKHGDAKETKCPVENAPGSVPGSRKPWAPVTCS